MTMFVSAGVFAVGAGLSIASATGAFNGRVDPNVPTKEELEAAAKSKQLFEFGRNLQKPLDKQALKDLSYFKSPAYLASQEGLARDQVMAAGSPALEAGGLATAARTGGPGSGAWWAQQGTGGAQLDAALRQAGAGGRLGGIQNYVGRAGQFIGRKTADVATGLDLMQQGAGQAYQSQQNRIAAQIGRNQATAQAMGAIGGSLMSVGSMGMGAAAGPAVGAATGTIGQGISNVGSSTYRPGWATYTPPAELRGY